MMSDEDWPWWNAPSRRITERQDAAMNIAFASLIRTSRAMHKRRVEKYGIKSKLEDKE